MVSELVDQQLQRGIVLVFRLLMQTVDRVLQRGVACLERTDLNPVRRAFGQRSSGGFLRSQLDRNKEKKKRKDARKQRKKNRR